MQTIAIVRAFSIVLATVGFTACDKSPTSPAPVPRTEPTIVGLKPMGGPELLQVGETARYSVMAIMSDRSERDVTNEAQWSGGEAVSISGPGLVTGRAPGVAELAAVVGGRRVPGRVTVLPAGTYRLEGQVHEANDDYPWQGVEGARIDVTTGTGAGLSTLTNAWGAYRFDGVAGETTLRVTRDGYQPVELKFGVVSHRNYDIELPLLAPRADVAGTYMLTITAADHCGVGLGNGHVPDEARVRTYTAEVRQEGPALALTLSGATFLGWSRDAAGRHVGVSGRVEPGRLLFGFPGGDGNELPYVLEQLPTSSSFFVAGNVVATGSANRFAGTLAGVIAIFDGILGPNDITGRQAIAWCSSTSHQFVLSR
jgi:Carboxypeptidase regulatory-like domain